ncbi:MAG: aldo/keto reductase [Pedosphaera sp. Tous-C6FEB]|nr:MAG: aldo/keto reductase [Pedosphaera sp. Tous-C6FEB]
MNTILLGDSSLRVSRLAYGCWRIADTEEAGRTIGRSAILAAYEAGYTLFDHADIYCAGRAEKAFGDVLREVSGMRERVLIATKCGIRLAGEPLLEAPVRYDFSAAHITWSCEQSLRRLGVETIDLYQLHRPDWLMNPQEVAVAFTQLRQQGKVREFGVSNFRPSQLTALQRALAFPLITNQVEISLANLNCFTDGTLDQCLAEHITPMAWSPLAGGLLAEGARRLLPSQEGYRVERIVVELDLMARARGATRGSLALAWLLKHPAGIVPIVGSTKPEKIRDAVNAPRFEFTREEWYRLLELARGERLP